MGDKMKEAMDYHTKGYNCGQSVFLCFRDECGLDEKTAARLSNCLGGGLSQTKGICGAVSGGCLAISARYGRDEPSREGEALERQKKTYALVQGLHDEFRKRYGAVDCPALLERGLADSGDAKNDKFNCHAYVALAAELVEKAMETGTI